VEVEPLVDPAAPPTTEASPPDRPAPPVRVPPEVELLEPVEPEPPEPAWPPAPLVVEAPLMSVSDEPPQPPELAATTVKNENSAKRHGRIRSSPRQAYG
jgi:hypothetical protein